MVLVEFAPLQGFAGLAARKAALGGSPQGVSRRVGTIGTGGPGVASQWRIRHKLTLALGLVIANLAILLGGSLWGLFSNSATMQSIRRKVQEQGTAEIVRDYVRGM